MIKQIRSDNSRQYISNELKMLVLISRIIHDLILPYLLQSNQIVERINDIMNLIACLMSITASDFPSL
jgi:transposase InsO family protein